MNTLEFSCRLENSFFNNIHVYVDKNNDPYYITLKNLFDLALKEYTNNQQVSDDIDEAWYAYYMLFIKHLGNIFDLELRTNNFESEKVRYTRNNNYFEDMCDYDIYWHCSNNDVAKYWAEDLWEVLDHYTKDNPLDNNDNDDCDDGEEEDYPDYNWFDD